MLLNAAEMKMTFMLPSDGAPNGWTVLLDTEPEDSGRPARDGRYEPGEPYGLSARSLALLEASRS
jgi:hypothetical protein